MGSLLNVDYNDELTRLRVHEIVKYLQRLGIPLKLNKIPNDIIADAFYVHYRTPILKEEPPEEEDAVASSSSRRTYLQRFIMRCRK
jgi:uncharacterized protein with von Willebrand factor type A (vWA) domain